MWIRVLIAFLFVAPAAFAGDIQTKELKYKSGDQEFVGFMAWDARKKGKRPGVLVVHEWWGHNEYARERAKDLAELGYVGFALDMYGSGKTADHPKEASAFSSAVKKNMGEAEKRFKAAMTTLKNQDMVNDEKIGAIGYCFGGGIVLEMARRGLDLDAVASFHGSLGTDERAEKGEIKARVFVANGAADPFVKKEEIEALKKEMEAADAKFDFVNYAGAKHSFTNPGADKKGKKFDLPLAYNEKADKASWKRMKSTFQKAFN